MRIACVALPAVALLLVSPSPLLAQPAAPAAGVCRGDAALQGMPVRRVTIESRGGWQPVVRLPFGPGDPFDFPQFSEAHTTVREALSRDSLRDTFEASGESFLSVIVVTSCVTVVEGAACASVARGAVAASCVDVTLRPYSLRLDLGSAAGNAVPAPRSNRGTFYSQVPTVLRVFNPAFAVTQDSQLGVSETAHLSTDLLTLPSMLKGRPSDDKRASLTLAAGGSKSLDKPFYQARSDLALDVRRTGKLVERYSAGLGAWAVEQPVGGGTHFDNSIETGGGVMLRPGMRGVSGVTLGSSYRWSNHRFFESDVSPGESTDEHAVKARALADGRAGDGTWRAAGWFEAASPVEETFAPYARLALLGGYQVEIGPTEQTVGLEVLGGAGWAGEAVSRPVLGTIRTIPGYARFYAGTPASRFLYDAPDTPAMQAFPTGPILRSFGRAERGVRHATGVERYWHVNLNVTVPLPGLSCPLVPAIPLFDDGASKDMSASPCRVRRPAAGVTTLKDSMNGAVNSGESFLRADIADELVQQGVDPDEADRQAEKRAAAVFRDIRPAMRFLTEKANLYAVKPLFMADAARIMTDGTGDASVRVAVGGGVQVAIAVAKFEAGYLHTVRGAAGDPSGNFIVRFVVANLF